MCTHGGICYPAWDAAMGMVEGDEHCALIFAPVDRL